MILGRIRTELQSLPLALRRVGETILSDPAMGTNWTIGALAERSGSSPASVTRFATAFGFDGYQQLRVALAAEVGRAEHAGWGTEFGHDIGPDDKLESALAVIAADDARVVRQTAAELDPQLVDAVGEKISHSDQLLMFGSASSGHMAGLGAGLFREIGVPAWSHTDIHEALSHAALLGERSVAIGVSHHGRTSEVIETITQAGERGATTVAITSIPRSPLAELADYVLLTGARETTIRRGSLSVAHSQLLVLDALYVAVTQRTYDAKALQRTLRR